MTDPKSSKAETITPFDIAEHLETDADIRDFLRETANNGNASDFIHALNIAARAKGHDRGCQTSRGDTGQPVQVACR